MKNNSTTHLLVFMIAALVNLTAEAQQNHSSLLPEANRDYAFDYQTLEPIGFKSFAEAAEWADVVTVAQVVNIDYLKTRDLNSQGQGFLNVLVPYKGTEKNELLIVSSKGFEEHVCYYPDRVEEGERFLVFLKKSANEGEYHGFKPYCQLQVLLTETGHYALRYPVKLGFDINPDLVKSIKYNDPHAVIDATSWTGISREQHQKDFFTELSEDSDLFQKYFYLTYTKGIMIYDIRPLMNITTQQRIHSKQM
jgi:hypothetical protein